MKNVQLFDKLEQQATILNRKRMVNKTLKKRKDLLKKYGVPTRKLSQSQIEEIKKVYNNKINDFTTHEMIYSITGKFNPYICPERLHYSKLDIILNEKKTCHIWSDKNYSDKFFPNVKMPITIVRNIRDNFYDADYKLISKEEAINKISKYDKVCMKPAIGRAGQGVRLVDVAKDLNQEINTSPPDYIVQEVLDQYEPLKKLNPTSVNIVRVCTVFLNGKVSVVSATLRCGAKGAFNDNSITADGKGMFCIGVDLETGKLSDIGYYSCGVSLDKAPNGEDFAGIHLPNFEKAKEIAKSMHSQMPFAVFIGFDVAFDSKGEPTIMEFNLTAPGAFYYQLIGGPLFGDRTPEIIEKYFSE